MTWESGLWALGLVFPFSRDRGKVTVNTHTLQKAEGRRRLRGPELSWRERCKVPLQVPPDPKLYNVEESRGKAVNSKKGCCLSAAQACPKPTATAKTHRRSKEGREGAVCLSEQCHRLLVAMLAVSLP